ncbi:MAG: hypothetical protein WC697_03425 [Patescibacteria group bacterium]|jgi:hypothetical protein
MSKILIPNNETGGSERWESIEIERFNSEKQRLDLYLEAYSSYLDRTNIRTKELESKIDNLNNETSGITKATEFIKWLTVGIAIAFFIACVPIFLDYYKNNEDRYEKFINKTVEIENYANSNFVTNENFGKEMKNIQDNNKINSDILNCLKGKKYWQYEQCFK